MKTLRVFTELILKSINYSLDYSIKIIGIFGLIWGIYIIYQVFTQKSSSPPSISDMILVSGAIILTISVISTLISTMIVMGIKSEKSKQLHYIKIHKAWWIVLVIFDFIAVTTVMINALSLPTPLISPIITNTLLTIASFFSAFTAIVYIYGKDAKELLGHRILFLRDKGEKLRESYVNFISVLGLADNNTKPSP